MRIICIIFSLMIQATLASQSNTRISGTILDMDRKAVADVVVMARDSLSETIRPIMAYTDNLGNFRMQDTLFIYNQIVVSRLGYITKSICLDRQIAKMTIILEKDSTYNLDEVLVKGYRALIKVETDRLIYNMEANPHKKDNVLECFKSIPLLFSDGNSFSIIGKSSTKVYINGKESLISQDALTEYLKNFPSERIKSIEVILSPNSTFRGEGNFGIINIILKENENEGLLGLFSSQLWKTHYFKERGNLSLLYKKNRLTVNLIGGVSNQSDWKQEERENIYKTTFLKTIQDAEISGFTRGAWGAFELNYEFSSKNTLGLNLNSSIAKQEWVDKGLLYFCEDNSTKPLSRVLHDNKMNRSKMDVNMNINYRHVFGKPEEFLDIDFDYVHSYGKQSTWTCMDNVDELNNIISPYNYYKEVVPQNSNVWSAKIEYTSKMTKNLFKLGMDNYFSQIDNNDKYLQFEENNYINDNTKSNHFAINEFTTSLFTYWRKNWKESLSTGIGCRMEHTSYTTHQYTILKKENRNYWRIMPSIYFTYTPSLKHILSYALTNRIQRPSFSSFNPFRVFTSATNYETGNMDLKPEYIVGQSVQYHFLKRFLLQASYQMVFDQIYELDFVKDDDMIETKPVNIGRYDYLLLSFNTNTSYLNSYANLNMTLSYTWQRMGGNIKGVTEKMGYVSNVFEVNMNNNFILSKKQNWSFDVDLSFNTKDLTFHRETPMKLYAYIQLKKQINSWMFALYGFSNTYIYNNNITTKWRNIYETNELRSITYIKGEPVGFGIRVSYKFGNNKVKNGYIHNASGSEVKSRL